MPAVTRELEAETPYRFRLDRIHDVTGVSGPGVVAWGALWPDGTVSLRWNTDTPSYANWDSMAALVAVHGHGGATEVQWLDEPPAYLKAEIQIDAKVLRRLV